MATAAILLAILLTVGLYTWISLRRFLRTEQFEGPTVHEIRPFFIDDGTGTIAVAIDHATLDPELHPVSKEQIEANVFAARMIARDTTSTSYSEWLLAPDTRAGIIGTVGRADDGALHIVGTAESPVVISNRPGALVV